MNGPISSFLDKDFVLLTNRHGLLGGELVPMRSVANREIPSDSTFLLTAENGREIFRLTLCERSVMIGLCSWLHGKLGVESRNEFLGEESIRALNV